MFRSPKKRQKVKKSRNSTHVPKECSIEPKSIFKLDKTLLEQIMDEIPLSTQQNMNSIFILTKMLECDKVFSVNRPEHGNCPWHNPAQYTGDDDIDEDVMFVKHTMTQFTVSDIETIDLDSDADDITFFDWASDGRSIKRENI